jgi:hypothetical protein
MGMGPRAGSGGRGWVAALILPEWPMSVPPARVGGVLLHKQITPPGPRPRTETPQPPTPTTPHHSPCAQPSGTAQFRWPLNLTAGD